MHYFLRSNYKGDVLLSARTAMVFYVRHPIRGSLIAPVEHWMLDELEATFAIPDSTAHSLQLHVTFSEVDPRHEPACDRWLAYHLTPGHRSWAELSIVGGKIGSHVIEGHELTIANDLRGEESSLCKRANADRAALQRSCEAASHTRLPDAICVGVDAIGIDLRTKFGPARLDRDSVPRIKFDIDAHTQLIPQSGPEFVAAIEASRQLGA